MDYIQVPANSHISVPKKIKTDNRLSAKAKAIYWQLCMSEGQVLIKDLYSWNTDKESSVRSALKELEDVGYMTRERMTGKMGRIGGYKYQLYLEPIGTGASLENQGLTDSTRLDFQAPYIRESNKNIDSSKLEPISSSLNKKEKDNRGMTYGQPPLIPKQSRSNKSSVYKTCLGLINVFTDNDTLRKALQDYLAMRIKTGLSEGQFKVLLDELMKFAEGDDEIMIERTRASFAAGYRNIAFLDAKKKQRKGAHFDNIAHHGHSDSDGTLATDENGEVLVY